MPSVEKKLKKKEVLAANAILLDTSGSSIRLKRRFSSFFDMHTLFIWMGVVGVLASGSIITTTAVVFHNAAPEFHTVNLQEAGAQYVHKEDKLHDDNIEALIQAGAIAQAENIDVSKEHVWKTDDAHYVAFANPEGVGNALECVVADEEASCSVPSSD